MKQIFVWKLSTRWKTISGSVLKKSIMTLEPDFRNYNFVIHTTPISCVVVIARVSIAELLNYYVINTLGFLLNQ